MRYNTFTLTGQYDGFTYKVTGIPAEDMPAQGEHFSIMIGSAENGVEYGMIAEEIGPDWISGTVLGKVIEDMPPLSEIQIQKFRRTPMRYMPADNLLLK